MLLQTNMSCIFFLSIKLYIYIIFPHPFALHPDSHEREGASNICVGFRGTGQMVWSNMLSITRKLTMISSQETTICTLCTTVLVLKMISVTNVFPEPKMNQTADFPSVQS